MPTTTIAGHEVEFNFQDDGCSAEGGTAAARALAVDPLHLPLDERGQPLL